MNTKSITSFAFLILMTALSGCGGTSVGNPIDGTVTLQTNQLAGPGAAYNRPQRIFEFLFGIQNAFAAVSPFNTFNICLSSVTFESYNGFSNVPLNPGLLQFSPTSTVPMTLGTVGISSGSTLKNIKFVIATKPEICGGANYSVLFNSPASGGDRTATQDVAFRFDFSTPYLLLPGDQTVTLFLGLIVDALYNLGATLSDTTIQAVNVGQAQ